MPANESLNESNVPPPAPEVKVWRNKHRPSSRRRRTIIRSAVLAFALIVGCGVTAGWLAFRANEVRTSLREASQVIPDFQKQVLAGDEPAARESLRKLTVSTGVAKTAVSDPVWKAASLLPWIGVNFSAIAEVAISSSDVVEGAAQPLLGVSQTLDWENLTPRNGRFDISPLAEATNSIVAAANTVELTHSRLSQLDQTRLAPEVAAPLQQATETLDEVRKALNGAADTAKVLPSMMGANEARNYLVLVQNSAEVRATGGLPGALAVLRVEDGRIQLIDQSSGSAMGKFQPPVEVDPEQTQIFTSRLGSYISDVNLTPDFPTAARSAEAMWELRHKTRLDGVIALDPVVLAHLLEATGPVKLTGAALPPGTGLPSNLTDKNVVQTLLSDVYSKLESNTSQDDYFAAVTREVFNGLTSGRASGKNLIVALAKSVDENRLWVWSDHDDEQKVLVTTTVGGSTSGRSVGGASFGAYFNDGTGAKMDFHVKRTVQLSRECPVGGYTRVKVRVTTSNEAPLNAATALPKAVTGGGLYGVPPGTVQTNVVVYGPAQAQIETVDQDGVKTPFGSYVDGQRPVGIVTTRLEPGQSNSMEFIFGNIVQHDEPILLVTPTVQPVEDVIKPPINPACTSSQPAP